MAATDIEGGYRSLQLAIGGAAIAGFSAYFAAKQLMKPFVEQATKENRAWLIGGFGVACIVIAAVYSMFVIYRASAKTKVLAIIALFIALGGGYGSWIIGWNKGGNPSTVNAF